MQTAQPAHATSHTQPLAKQIRASPPGCQRPEREAGSEGPQQLKKELQGQPSPAPANVCPRAERGRFRQGLGCVLGARDGNQRTWLELKLVVPASLRGLGGRLPMEFCRLIRLTGAPSRASHRSRAAPRHTKVTGTGSPWWAWGSLRGYRALTRGRGCHPRARGGSCRN